MAMRTTLTRMNFMKRAAMQRRGFSGRVLNEEEKAAENVYIKKMEKEKIEKAVRQAEGKTEEVGKGSESISPETESAQPKDISTDSTKNVAVAAGVVMFLAAGWWYQRANKQVPVSDEDKE